jgi:hypothetical protein
MRAKNYSGRKFGRLLALRKFIKYGRSYYACKCDCGKEVEVSYSNLYGGNTNSCGCLKREVISRLKRKSDLQIISNGMWRYYRRNAKTRNIIFDLSRQDFDTLIHQPCGYCGSTGETYYTNAYHIAASAKVNGIDRIDPTQGYFLPNCIPCCKTCNHAKASMSLVEFQEWMERVYNYMKE